MDGIERFGRDFMKAQQWGDFARLDADALRRYSDAELAAWQSEYPSDSPQWLLAELVSQTIGGAMPVLLGKYSKGQ